jgi:hypothetical protein
MTDPGIDDGWQKKNKKVVLDQLHQRMAKVAFSGFIKCRPFNSVVWPFE